MVEKITEGLYRITVALPNSPLKSLNSYYIAGIDEDYVIDTGFNKPECEEDLTAGLKEIGADRSRISILNTHMHTDHTGQNHKYLAEGHHVYMTESDMQWVIRAKLGLPNPRTQRDMIEGAPSDFFEKNQKVNPLKIYKPADITAFLVPVHDRQIISAKYFDIQVIEVPGHTTGNCMFWIEKEKIMLTGDHILFDITPNITFSPVHDDILGTYIESLKKSKAFTVKTAMPGHRSSGDYQKRIDEIIIHHEERLSEVENIIGNSEKPLNAFEITSLMKWRVRLDPDGSMPVAQLYFASGECMAHIDHLIVQDRIRRIDPHDSMPYRTYVLK